MSEDRAMLPGRLPAGERVLWQGRPCWRTLARRAFHIRKLAAYFAVLLTWYAATVFMSPGAFGDAVRATARMAAVATIPLALIGLYAWMSSRAALYTITSRRLVLRGGIAMPITFNLPLARIEAAGLKTWADGTGDLVVTLTPPDKLAYLVLWPHAKPWAFARPKPMLRCIPEAERAAQILARALATAADMPVQASGDKAAEPAAVRPHAAALA